MTIQGPLSARQILAITNPNTAERDRNKVILNQERTIGQVRGCTESWANRYLNEHPLGRKLSSCPECGSQDPNEPNLVGTHEFDDVESCMNPWHPNTTRTPATTK